MIKRGTKFLLKFFLWLVLFAAITISAGIFWLSQKPRDLEFLVKSTENEINSISSALHVEIGGAYVIWGGWDRGLDFYLSDIILFVEHAEPIEIPKVEVQWAFLDLIYRPYIQLDKVTIENAEISFENLDFVNNDSSSNTSFYQKIIADIMRDVKQQGDVTFESIEFKDLIVNIDSESKQWNIPLFSADFRYTPKNTLEFLGQINIQTNSNDDNPASLFLRGRVLPDLTAEVDIATSTLATDELATLSPRLEWLAPAVAKWKINSQMLLHPNGLPSYINTRSTIRGIGEHDFSSKVEANFSFNNENSLDIPEVNVTANLNNFYLSDLASFWPEFATPETRDYIVSHFPQGWVKNANLKLGLSSNDIKQETIEDGYLRTDISFADLTFTEPGTDFKVTRGNGDVYIDKNHLEVRVVDGIYNDSLLSNAVIRLNDFWGTTSVDLSLNIDKASFSDALNAYHAYVNDKDINWINNYAKVSDINGKFGFTITDIDAENLEDHFHPDFNINLNHITPKNNPIEQPIIGSGILKADNAAMTLDVTANLKNGPLSFNYFYPLTSNKKEGWKASGKLTHEEIEQITKISLSEYVDGILLLDASSVAGKEAEQDITLSIDASQAKISPQVTIWEKPKGEPAIISAIISQVSQDEFNIPMLKVEHASLYMSAEAMINPNMKYLNIHRLRTEFNDFSASFEQSTDGPFIVTLIGHKANLRPFLNFKERKKLDSNFWEQDFFSKVRLERLGLKKKIELFDVVFDVECSSRYCEKIQFDAKTSQNKNMHVAFGPQDSDNPAGINVFDANLENAGDFIRGFGLSEYIFDGHLKINAMGSFEQAATGTIRMTDFSVTKAPLLGRLFTVGSFTSLGEILSGKGISFKELDGKFTYADTLIDLKTFKAFGPATGITAKGKIDLGNHKINLKGALIPSYTINSFFGKIPLIGEILGGKEGEGLIASRYSIKGPLDDPEVSVNPFSMLTPGFLRNIWETGETPEEIDEKPTPEAEATPIAQ